MSSGVKITVFFILSLLFHRAYCKNIYIGPYAADKVFRSEISFTRVENILMDTLKQIS